MSGHTPGPWTACGLWVCEENDPSHNVGICNCEERDEAEANASLIAAAPDLLEALKELHLLIDFDEALTDDKPMVFGDTSAVNEAMTRARAAIAKAEGKPE